MRINMANKFFKRILKIIAGGLVVVSILSGTCSTWNKDNFPPFYISKEGKGWGTVCCAYSNFKEGSTFYGPVLSFINSNEGVINGCVLTFVNNSNKGTLNGLELSVISDSKDISNEINGFQGSLLFCKANKINGFQGSLLGCEAVEAVGMQFSLINNKCSRLTGWQVCPIYNRADYMYGSQTSIIANESEESKGLQVSLFGNTSGRKNTSIFQVGITNYGDPSRDPTNFIRYILDR
jgi:hypothetical protein